LSRRGCEPRLGAPSGPAGSKRRPGTAIAVRALERRIDGTVGTVADSWALEVQAVRDRLQALQAGAMPGARLNERPLLEHVARIEVAGRLVAGGTSPSPAVRSELRAALELRWSDFNAAVHEELTREESARLWRIGERFRQQRWVLLFVGLAAAGILVAALYSTGLALQRAAAQARALAAGDFAIAAAPPVIGGDFAGLRADIGRAATALSAADARRRADQVRSERFFQRLQVALGDIADGQRARQLPPGEDPACAGAMGALGLVVARLYDLEAREDAARSRAKSLTPVSQEELYQLRQFLEFETSSQDQAAAALRPREPAE
jgi:hypothetical protein